jgi:mRNA-degrading endonuclease toxin of MazEF toxin-antitoxin module
MNRGEVHLVRLDPTPGSEIKKTRPCLGVSPDELNGHLRTAIVAAMTTGGERIHGAFGVGSRTDPDTWPWINCERSTRNGS